jgi:hypothetical protein
MVMARIRRQAPPRPAVGDITPRTAFPGPGRVAGPVNPNRTGGSFRPPTVPPGFKGAAPLVKLLDERAAVLAQQKAAGARQAALPAELAKAKREDEADAIAAIRTGAPPVGHPRQHAVEVEIADNASLRRALSDTRAAVEADIVRAVRDSGAAWRRDVERLVASKQPEVVALRSKLTAAEAELRTLTAFAAWLSPVAEAADDDDDAED